MGKNSVVFWFTVSSVADHFYLILKNWCTKRIFKSSGWKNHITTADAAIILNKATYSRKKTASLLVVNLEMVKGNSFGSGKKTYLMWNLQCICTIFHLPFCKYWLAELLIVIGFSLYTIGDFSGSSTWSELGWGRRAEDNLKFYLFFFLTEKTSFFFLYNSPGFTRYYIFLLIGWIVPCQKSNLNAVYVVKCIDFNRVVGTTKLE